MLYKPCLKEENSQYLQATTTAMPELPFKTQVKAYLKTLKTKYLRLYLRTKVKGQGLGLAAVKRFTEAMGGTVTFESQAGIGTTFTISLPSSKKQEVT